MGEIASRGLQRGGGIEFVEAIETMVSNIYIYIYLFGFDEGEFRLTFQPLKSATKNIFDIDHALPSGSRM